MHGRGACSFAWQAPAALILGVWLFVVPDGGHGLIFLCKVTLLVM